MADYVNTGQPNGQVLTYNTTNDRGWNDPPKHVFSSTNSNRKRIDPRKRVCHDLTSTTVQQQPAGSCHGYMNGYMQPTFPGVPTTPNKDDDGSSSHGYMNGYVQPPPPSGPTITNTDVGGGSLHHTSSNPDLHKMATEPLIMQHSSSMPFNLNTREQQGVCVQPTFMPASPKSLESTCSPPLVSGGKPLQQCPSPNKSLLNDKTQDGRKLVAPTSNLNNSSIFNHLGTPTMLQSSHLANKPTSPDTQIISRTVNNTTNQSHAQLLQPPGSNGNANMMSNNFSPQMSSLPPISLPSAIAPTVENNLYTRTNSLPGGFTQGKPPVITAPPTDGFYVGVGKTLNSPKSNSPQNSGPNSPVPKKDKPIIENDSELLNETVDKLLDCRNKCACIITSKNSEDISKKIQTFKLAWSSGKLSPTVKVQMSNLSAALEKREFAQADTIHKSLIVSHGSEVISWMVGVKKLISSYQKVVEENNKY